MKLISASFGILVFFLNLSVQAGTTTEIEPNNIFSSSQSISSTTFTVGVNPELENDSLPTASIQGDIDIDGGNRDDVDFYCFSAQAASPLFLDIDYGMNQGDSVDNQLALFNASGTLLAANDDTSSTVGGTGSIHSYDAFIGEFTIPATGRYCVAVTSYDNDPTTFGNGTLASTSLSLGGRSYTGATVGESTFDNAGGSTGDYTLHISVHQPPPPTTSIPTLSEWALLLLIISLIFIGQITRKEN